MKKFRRGNHGPGPQDPGGYRRRKRRGTPETPPKKHVNPNNRGMGFWGGSGFGWDAWMNGNSPRHGMEEMAEQQKEREGKYEDFGGPGF